MVQNNLKLWLALITTHKIHARQSKQKQYIDKHAGKQHPKIPLNTQVKYLNNKGHWSKATVL